MRSSPGVHVQRAAPPPARRARLTSVTGFVGLAPRGPLDLPQRLASWGEYETVFGGITAGSYLGPAVYGFFANGGEVCYVVRAADSLSEERRPVSAVFALLNGDPDRDLILFAAANQGTWGNQLELQLSPSVDKTVLTRLSTAAAAGAIEIALSSTADLGPGSSITLVDPTSQARATVVVDEVAENSVSLSAPLAAALPAASLVRGFGLDLGISFGKQVEEFTNLSLDPAHPRYLIDMVNGDPAETSYLARISAGSSVLVRASFAEGVSATEVRPLLGVDLSEISIVGNTAGCDAGLPIAVGFLTGYDSEGAYFPVPDPASSSLQGLASLEPIDEIDLIAIPDLGSFPLDELLAGQLGMLGHCEVTGNRFAILDAPAAPADIDDLGDHAEGLAFASGAKNGALYHPWLRMTGLASSCAFVPASGLVAGVFARTSALQWVHQAPANVALEEVCELEQVIDDLTQTRLNQAGINCVRAFAGRGIRIWGARTLSRTPQWRYVPVRRVLLVIKKQVRQALQWAVFEPNNQALQRAISATLRSYLDGLYRGNVLAGSQPEDAYFVKCDDETNPAEGIERGEVVAEIGFAPLNPAEFILATIKRTGESVDVSFAE